MGINVAILDGGAELADVTRPGECPKLINASVNVAENIPMHHRAMCLSKVNLHGEANLYLPLFFSAVEVHCLLEQLSILFEAFGLGFPPVQA